MQGKISQQVFFFSHSSPSQFGNKCNINLTNRKRCQECRLAKCYAKVKEDRRCDCHEVFLVEFAGHERGVRSGEAGEDCRPEEESQVLIFSPSFHSAVLPSSCIDNRLENKENNQNFVSKIIKTFSLFQLRDGGHP